MPGFTKLFNSILHSTIWSEPNETKILWITMLAMSDRNGCVFASVPGLARMAGITVDQTSEGLSRFLSPDPYSRTPDHEGRRIQVIQGGWHLLNHGKYRELLSLEERREYNRVKQAERRQKLSNNVNNLSPDVTACTPGQHITDSRQQTSDIKNIKSGYSVPACFESVDGFTAALAGWIEARRLKRNPPTGRAIQTLINRLSERPSDAVKALDLAIERGWTTVKWDWFDNDSKQRVSENRGGDIQRPYIDEVMNGSSNGAL